MGRGVWLKGRRGGTGRMYGHRNLNHDTEPANNGSGHYWRMWVKGGESYEWTVQKHSAHCQSDDPGEWGGEKVRGYKEVAGCNIVYETRPPHLQSHHSQELCRLLSCYFPQQPTSSTRGSFSTIYLQACWDGSRSCCPLRAVSPRLVPSVLQTRISPTCSFYAGLTFQASLGSL